MLGYMYHKGRGLPTHNKLAMLWFRRAAEMGDSRAMVNLGVMNFRCEPFTANFQKRIFKSERSPLR